MKDKLLVIIHAIQSSDLSNALRNATPGQELPKGVQQIFDRTFLIDTHTCLPFFVSLVNSAEKYNLAVAVLAVDDEAVLTTDLFPNPLKK
jgi:hypothetical protein